MEPGCLGPLPSPPPGQHWPATMWDLLRVARDGSGEDRERAWKGLFESYYKPVRRFFERVRRLRDDELDDVTQDFFRRFLEKDFLRNLREERSFRNFLKLACERHHLNWIASRKPHRPLETDVPAWEEASGILDQELRASFLEQALARTKSHLEADGKELYFRIFEARARFDGEKPPPLKDLADRFGLPPFQLNNHLEAARKVFRATILSLATERRPDDPRTELDAMGLRAFVD